MALPERSEAYGLQVSYFGGKKALAFVPSWCSVFILAGARRSSRGGRVVLAAELRDMSSGFFAVMSSRAPSEL